MILQKIKVQTQDSHTSLENSQLLRPISEKSLTLDAYILILQKFYGFFYPLEQLIARFPVGAYLPDIAERRKAGWLKNDLRQITHTDPVLPLCQQMPAVESLAEAFGCLYVMEGSTLGGKLIYKTVQDSLGLTQYKGLSFFYGYGPDTGSKWKSFQQSMLALSSQDSSSDTQIIGAANHTFSAFKQWLESDSATP
jgi:heme oxygenase